ncbi:MAG: hypothetical protein PHY92_09385 [Alphaproteobacteria bacterium]|nr:hypothetical protein [Alphaproteobacteria bacterium]
MMDGDQCGRGLQTAENFKRIFRACQEELFNKYPHLRQSRTSFIKGFKRIQKETPSLHAWQDIADEWVREQKEKYGLSSLTVGRLPAAKRLELRKQFRQNALELREADVDLGIILSIVMDKPIVPEDQINAFRRFMMGGRLFLRDYHTERAGAIVRAIWAKIIKKEPSWREISAASFEGDIEHLMAIKGRLSLNDAVEEWLDRKKTIYGSVLHLSPLPLEEIAHIRKTYPKDRKISYSTFKTKLLALG